MKRNQPVSYNARRAALAFLGHSPLQGEPVPHYMRRNFLERVELCTSRFEDNEVSPTFKRGVR